MKIDVRQEFIDAGKHNEWSCPIALAILGDHGIRSVVKPGVVHLGMADGEKVVALPREACDFVESYDKRGASGVKPFTFDVAIP